MSRQARTLLLSTYGAAKIDPIASVDRELIRQCAWMTCKGVFDDKT